MAKIVLCMGTSHGPLLTTPPEQWDLRVQADKQNPEHFFRGETYTYDQLAKLRSPEKLDAQCALAERQKRFDRCQVALKAMAEKFAQTKPDVAVIVGNDQHEIFLEDNMPAFSVFWGEEVTNIPSTEEQKAKMPPGIAIAEPGHKPPVETTYRCHPELGRHIIASLMEQEFDVAQSNKLPNGGAPWAKGIPHAYGFVYRQIMKDDVVPHVPVILNTFYPPNQPTARRCHKFGTALARAIESWDSDLTVAVIASGGLTHFVIDEDLDNTIVKAMQANDVDTLTTIPENRYQSGTSEVKNWIPVSAVATASGLAMDLVDYVPCYRSEAGTGNAMAFVHWS